jgi:2-keto-3-deoxy-L-rhamnonate aldolase RhmA
VSPGPRTSTLKARLAAREPIDAVNVRTPSYQVIEAFAARGVSCVMVDTEHAAFDAAQLDATLAVASGLAVDVLVRVPAGDRGAIQQALDGGATGVIVPHVATAPRAADVVRWCHYGDGGRGFSGSTRSAGWGTRTMAEVVGAAARSTVVVVQVEDVGALDELDGIVGTAGVDAVFVGAADLAVALGAASLADERVVAACARIVETARSAGRSVVAYAADAADAIRWRDSGANLVILGSDQSRLSP